MRIETKNKTITRSINGWTQHLFRFNNGLGASVVKHHFSYGNQLDLWELAVIEYTGDGMFDYNITHSTPVTDDVLGHLTIRDVNYNLSRIKRLKIEEGF